ARILYNHVYFSGLPHAYSTALLREKSYRRIVDHANYSPRIVEWMTLGGGPAGVGPESYTETFVQVLDDPARLWQHAFENQINDDARAILYCQGTIEGWMGLDELRSAWASLRGIASTNDLPIDSKKAFVAAMKRL